MNGLALQIAKLHININKIIILYISMARGTKSTRNICNSLHCLADSNILLVTILEQLGIHLAL